MKRITFTFLLCGISLMGLTSCNLSKKADEIMDPTDINEQLELIEIDKELEPMKIDGILMTIKEGSLTESGVTVIINDKTGKNYVYGIEFRIDKKENGKWISPKKNGNNCAFTTKAYSVGDDGFLEFRQNWGCMYGKLEEGTYRLVKYTFLKGSIQKKYFFVEFTIE